MTQDGHKYSDYISTLQDEFQKEDIKFLMNRKFQKHTTNMKLVGCWQSMKNPPNCIV